MFETKVEYDNCEFGVDFSWEKCNNCQSVRFLAKMEYKTVTQTYKVWILSEQRITENKLVQCLMQKYAKCGNK